MILFLQVGLWIDAGSRFENEKNNGVAHFLEHMIFKVAQPAEPGYSVELINRKVPKFLDTRKICCYHSKTGKKSFYHSVMHPRDADSIANSEDPDQTAPLGAV